MQIKFSKCTIKKSKNKYPASMKQLPSILSNYKKKYLFRTSDTITLTVLTYLEILKIHQVSCELIIRNNC